MRSLDLRRYLKPLRTPTLALEPTRLPTETTGPVSVGLHPSRDLTNYRRCLPAGRPISYMIVLLLMGGYLHAHALYALMVRTGQHDACQAFHET